MRGIHDVGGADGFGPILVEENEPVWHAEWEKAAFSFFAQCAIAGYFNLDEFRHSMEKMDPVQYLSHPYYAHWMHSFEEYLARDDSTFTAELDRRTAEYLKSPELPLPPTVNHELADTIGALAFAGAPTRRDVDRPAGFKIGDLVRVSGSVPVGHTRKVGYATGRVGTIISSHGSFVFPDTNAHGGGEAPDYVYSVQFSAEELFGESIGDPKARVICDLWEPYLSLASTTSNN
ncbi:nitrile hydratase subunit beta [Arthrobacter sp. R4]|uniref:nitrile hydratase subunit beta n=1 Tax=Arthrobacter sp. R4 TaxID=644417 RepID=UPI003ED9257C